MKMKLFAGAAALLLSVVAAGNCFAQQPALSVNIPFAFQAGSQTLPAGEYRVETVLNSSGCMQRIRQVNGGASAVMVTISVDSSKGAPEPELLFNRYGDKYFLWQIWTGDDSGRQLFKSHREKELALESVSGEIALLLHPLELRP